MTSTTPAALLYMNCGQRSQHEGQGRQMLFSASLMWVPSRDSLTAISFLKLLGSHTVQQFKTVILQPWTAYFSKARKRLRITCFPNHYTILKKSIPIKAVFKGCWHIFETFWLTSSWKSYELKDAINIMSLSLAELKLRVLYLVVAWICINPFSVSQLVTFVTSGLHI